MLTALMTLALLSGVPAHAGSDVTSDWTRFSPRELSLHHHAVAHWGMGMFETAGREFEALLAQRPGDASVLANLGAMSLSQRRFEAAVERLRPAVKAAPTDARARYLLGRAFAGAGKNEDAVAELRKAARLAPSEPGIPFALSEVHLALGQPAEAEKDLRGVLKLSPDYAPALNRLGRVLGKMGREKEARGFLRRFARVRRGARRALCPYDGPTEPPFTNDEPREGHILQVRTLPAKPGTSAQVIVLAGRQVLSRRSGEKGVSFLLAAPKADAVRVDWASGEHSYAVDVDAGNILTLREVATHVW